MLHRCSASRQGLSLVELMISAGLVLLVLGLGASFLIPLLHMQVEGAESAELEQRSAILIEDLRRDLAQTSAAGVSLVQSDQQVILGVHACDNVAQDGTLVWRDSLVIYEWSSHDKTWRRSLWSDATRRVLRATAPSRLSESTLRQAAREATNVRVTPGLSTVVIEHSGSNVSLPITARLALVSPAGETRQVVRTVGGRLPTL
jgi:hypothetical protein